MAKKEQNIRKIILESKEKELKEIREEVRNIKRTTFEWDFPKDVEFQYFDPDLSYELTGYRPINDTKGLDFNPEWFIEARLNFERTGHYCQYGKTSKAFREFWRELYRRCKYGYTVNNYTVTGDHYFFLNFYVLPLTTKNDKAGQGRPEGFPNFSVAQYKWFHYYELAKHLRLNCCMMKARGVGFSEINASIAACEFTVIKLSTSIIAGHDAKKMDDTLKKVWNALAFLDKNTDGGMSKVKLLRDTATEKKAGLWIQRNGEKIPTGWMSTVKGINASDPQNLRGDRADLLILDEAGSWDGLLRAYVQGQALINIGGVKFGNLLVGGTGGDRGKPLEGLKELYYHPEAYGILPYRHSSTQTGEKADTGFFIPAFEQVFKAGYIDNRGYCDPNKTKPLLLKSRDMLLSSPEGLLHHCAEYCWNAEEAFNLEGDNKFNKVALSNLLAEIRLHKRGPKPIAGFIDYTYKNSKHSFDNINGFKWIENLSGKVLILEHPVWSDLYLEEMIKLKRLANEEGVEFEAPVYKEMDNLYVAGIDGIDIGASQTSKETRDPSDFCIVILKRAFGLNEPLIVAMYKDRPNDIREAFKISMCLARYYNCKINIEATRMSMVNWARDNKLLSYFMKRPRATLTDVKNGTSKLYGTPATKTIIEQHTDLTAAFIEDYSHTIWFEEILQLLVSYNDENKGKFDIVASLGMVFLADLELSGRLPVLVEKEIELFLDFGYYYDERGIKRFGMIPTKVNTIIEIQEKYDDPYRIETSDPRVYERFI